jgi:hypothetical protein
MLLAVYKDTCNNGLELFAAKLFYDLEDFKNFPYGDKDYVTCSSNGIYIFYMKREDFLNKIKTITVSEEQIIFLTNNDLLFNNCDAFD